MKGKAKEKLLNRSKPSKNALMLSKRVKRLVKMLGKFVRTITLTLSLLKPLIHQLFLTSSWSQIQLLPNNSSWMQPTTLLFNQEHLKHQEVIFLDHNLLQVCYLQLRMEALLVPLEPLGALDLPLSEYHLLLVDCKAHSMTVDPSKIRHNTRSLETQTVLCSCRLSKWQVNPTGWKSNNNRQAECLKTNKKWSKCINKPLGRSWNIETSLLKKPWRCVRTCWKSASKFLKTSVSKINSNLR